MELTIKERFQLSNQFKILEKLYPEDKEYYARHREAIETGFELHYSWIFEHINSDTLSTEECQFVLDVLDMYSSFCHSFKEMETPTDLTADKIKFPGFDGNNETMYMAYTRYFINDLNRFGDIKDSSLTSYNSHIPMIPKYRKMVARWKELRIGFSHQLSEENIQELLDIRGY